jgi:hypothetical protein
MVVILPSFLTPIVVHTRACRIGAATDLDLRETAYCTSSSSLNIGRYIAMTITPTIAPTPIIISGSTIEVRAAIEVSTSSSSKSAIFEHLLELARLLPDLDHLRDERRKDGILGQGLGDGDALVHLRAHIRERRLPSSARRPRDAAM